jgi:hypothetical protein
MDATSWGLNAETRTRPLGSTATVLEKQQASGWQSYQLTSGDDHFKTRASHHSKKRPY